jgi:hypothetical protein
MAPNVLLYLVEGSRVRARSGTDEEHARLNSVRPIGGAEEMKWKKPNEFNSSE